MESNKNIIEQELEPLSVSSPFEEIEKERLKLAEKFLSEGINQKTQINKTERFLLPLIKIIANNPFPLSRKKCIKLRNFKIDVLNLWLNEFYELGIPLDRKGRKEEVEVLKSALSSEITPEQLTVTDSVNKLLK